MLILGVSNVAQANDLTLDEAKIRRNVQSFSTLADQGAYQYLGRILADNLVVDYTSLWGGEPTTTSNTVLMNQWAGFLPGFDATFHDLGDVDVEIMGDEAVANVEFTASHWLGDEGFWSVSGRYSFKFQRQNDDWVIGAIKLNFESESGNRDVLGEAPKLATERHAQREAKLIDYH